MLKENIFLVHYCHYGCEPFRNIMRFPREEAFLLAKKLAAAHPKDTAFGRFTDFTNYHPRRLEADRQLHAAFLALGGQPKEAHPLSFVLQGSVYLRRWFGGGTEIRIPLESVPSNDVSFTLGDSCAVYEKTGRISVLTKEMLQELAAPYGGLSEGFLRMAEKKHGYIEAQLWDDAVCRA